MARDGRDGVEVLVLERSAASRFAPGFLVFPGGAMEPGDEDLAERWFGDRAEVARACAVRELFEEAGILATAAGLRPAEDPARPIEEVDFEPLRPERIREMARWIAPDFLPRRFDARFFAVEAPPDLEPVPDGIEIARAWWTGADAVLDRASAGEASLMWPTLKTFEALRGCGRVADVLALQVPQVEPRVTDFAPARRPQWREPSA